MNTGYNTIVNGVNTDLVNIFEPYSTNKLTYDTGFQAGPNYNTDLTNIFQAYTTGNPIANNTKYICLNGLDLSQVFSKKNIVFPTASSNPPLPGNFINGLCMQDNYVIAASQSGNIYYSNDYGINFSVATGAPSSSYNGVAISGQRAIACGGSNLIYISSNYGQSWTQVTGLTGNFSWCAIYDNFALLSSEGLKKLYCSTNYGATWVECTSATTFAQPWRGVSITKHPSNGNYLAAAAAFNGSASGGGIYYCTNFTGSASDTFVKSVSTVSNSLCVSLDGLLGLASTFFNSVSNIFYYTTDGGQTWANSGVTSGSNQCGNISLSGQVGIGGFNNINECWVTKNAGVNWTKYIMPTPPDPGGLVAAATNKGNLIITSLSNKLAYYGKVP